MYQKDRYKITVEFIVKSESIDDAQVDLKSLIEYGIISLIDNDEIECVDEFDIVDSEPAEVI